MTSSEGTAPTTPELDYAFLAEFAKVDPNGLLTAIGASYTQIQVQQLPAPHVLHVAGRIRAPEGHPAMELSFNFRGPTEASPTVTIGGELHTEGATPYAGKVGLLFAIGTTVPLVSEGLHTLEISLDGGLVRRLAFEVHTRPAE